MNRPRPTQQEEDVFREAAELLVKDIREGMDISLAFGFSKEHINRRMWDIDHGENQN